MRHNFIDLGSWPHYPLEWVDFPFHPSEIVCNVWLLLPDHDSARCPDCQQRARLHIERLNGNPFTRPMGPR